MKNEISFHSFEEASLVAMTMLKNQYVVMLSREEDLYILNYIWSENADRNGVEFMSTDEYDAQLEEVYASAKEEKKEQCARPNTFISSQIWDDGQKDAFNNYLKELAYKNRN